MKNRLIGYTDIETLYQEHLRKQDAIWKELKNDLYIDYLSQGYSMWFAQVKAENDVLKIMSKPKNVCTMTIPKEQTTQGDLD